MIKKISGFKTLLIDCLPDIGKAILAYPIGIVANILIGSVFVIGIAVVLWLIVFIWHLIGGR